MSKKKIRCPECAGTGKAIGGVCTLCCSMGEINAPESEMDAIRAANPQLAASMEKFGADMAAATKRQLCKNESPALNPSELENLRAENARLREALEGVMDALEGVAKGHTIFERGACFEQPFLERVLVTPETDRARLALGTLRAALKVKQ